mmetsp:Transcript_23595/g.56257  ORF Transcript_23595/g.56257 Transcript_23595/m.56257 type:complete len:304 (-) Transcript_23595:88-999(-)
MTPSGQLQKSGGAAALPDGAEPERLNVKNSVQTTVNGDSLDYDYEYDKVQVELKKGQTSMVDANLQQPSGVLHEDVSERSELPADTFELYHGSKRLDGEAVLASWGVEKDSLIEVKTRGRGGMHGGGGNEGGADGGGSAGGGGGGTDSCLGGGGGGRGGGSGSSSGVGGVGSGSSGIGGADSGLGVTGGGVGGGGDAEGGGAGQEKTRNKDGKRPQNPEGKPFSPLKVHAEKQWLQNAKAAAELESEVDRNALDDIVAVTASAARRGIEAPMQARAAGSTCMLDIPHALCYVHLPPIPTPTPT